MVHAEGARLGLAHAAAIKLGATSALADERLVVQRRRSQDDTAPREYERRRTQDHREARDGPTQDDRKAQHREAHHKAEHGEAEHRETEYR